MVSSPTLRDIIAYYQRDDVLSILYHQTVHWDTEMYFLGIHAVLYPTTVAELRRTFLGRISQQISSLWTDKRPPEYPTLQVKADRGQLIPARYDWITEDDPESWQEAFERMKPVLDVLDTFGVYYQIQFSGHRSLHLRIPAEAFPKYFQEIPVADFQIAHRDETGHTWLYNPIHSAINRYLPPSGHSPSSLRAAYAIHPMTGLVSLPLRRDELESFRPWMASIYTVRIDRSWFSVPEDAPSRTADFLTEALKNIGKRKHWAWKARESMIKPPPPADTIRSYTDGHHCWNQS
jgi:hypothetical protein